jgi:NAD(P)-dependent dehydrogenase (short-subunit alcohol dehydrogenase family)
MELGGTVAVVTGGASGIGRGTALALARAGADVVVADIHPERTAETVAAIRELGREALGELCDVTSDDDVDALAATTLERFGRVDVVMNNAGVSVLGPPERVPMDDWRWVLDVNLLGVVRGIRAFAPALLAQSSGWIVNTASVAGLYAYSYDAVPYITSKHAVVGLSEGLHLHLRPKGVGVSVLCPGLVATNLGETARLIAIDDPAWTNFPVHMQRAIDPADVGEMVVGAIRDERFLILTHPEDQATVVAHGVDREAFLQGYLPRLYKGRDASGLPTVNVPPPEPVTPLVPAATEEGT